MSSFFELNLSDCINIVLVIGTLWMAKKASDSVEFARSQAAKDEECNLDFQSCFKQNGDFMCIQLTTANTGKPVLGIKSIKLKSEIKSDGEELAYNEMPIYLKTGDPYHLYIKYEEFFRIVLRQLTDSKLQLNPDKLPSIRILIDTTNKGIVPQELKKIIMENTWHRVHSRENEMKNCQHSFNANRYGVDKTIDVCSKCAYVKPF